MNDGTVALLASILIIVAAGVLIGLGVVMGSSGTKEEIQRYCQKTGEYYFDSETKIVCQYQVFTKKKTAEEKQSI